MKCPLLGHECDWRSCQRVGCNRQQAHDAGEKVRKDMEARLKQELPARMKKGKK